MKNLLHFLRKGEGDIHNAAALLFLMSFLSLIFSLFRDRLFAGEFGIGAMSDIYFTAFRIPDLLFILATSVVSVFALLPIIEKRINKGEIPQNLVNSIFAIFAILLSVLAVFTFFATPFFVEQFFSQHTFYEQGLLINITRILLLQSIFLSISAFISTIIQMEKRFMIYALAPILYTLGIIVGIITLAPSFGITGVAYGAVLGAFAHLLIQIWGVAGSQIKIQLRAVRIVFSDVYEVLSISILRTFVVSLYSITLLAFFIFAAKMSEGSVAVFSFADNLKSVPLLLVGIAYSIASFPSLSHLFAKGNYNEFYSKTLDAYKQIVFLILPITAVFIVFNEFIVSIILGTGQFDERAVFLTSTVLLVLIFSVIAQSTIVFLSRVYYAMHHRWIPLIINALVAILAIFPAYYATIHYADSPFLQSIVLRLVGDSLVGEEIIILAVIYTIANIIGGVLMLLSFIVSSKCKALIPILSMFGVNLTAAFALGATSFIALSHLEEAGYDIFLSASMSLVLGLFAWVAILRLLGNKELPFYYNRVIKILKINKNE